MATPRRSLRIDDETWADLQRRAEAVGSASEFIRQALAFDTLDAFPYVVYRIYADDDQLLYVGCSVRWKGRLRWHAQNQPWWGSVRRIVLDHFPDADSAGSAEAAAIEADLPRYNRDPGRYHHNGMVNFTNFNLRLTDELEAQVRERADLDRRSLNAEIVWLLERALDTERTRP